jgi:hypothetical protein
MNLIENVLGKQYEKAIEQFLVGNCTMTYLRTRLIGRGCRSVGYTKKGNNQLWAILTPSRTFYYEVDKHKKILLIGVRVDAMVTQKR